MNFITNENIPIKNLIQYTHATLFSPTKSTLLVAIRNNHLMGWPGLTIANANKYLQETLATAKGHLDQHRMNLRSTSNTSNPKEYHEYSKPYRTHQTIATLIDNSRTSKAYFDLTGQFPYTSARGFKYIFLL